MVALGLLLAGCTQPFPVPHHDLRLAERYDGASPRLPAPLSRWWTRFGSSELTRLIEASDFGNLDLAAAIARIEQAEAQARIAGATLLPALTLSGDSARTQSSGTTSRRAGIRPASVTNSFSGLLAASYELDIWGRNRDLLEAARGDLDAARYALHVVRLSTQGAIANAYFTLAASRERLTIAEDNLRNAERILGVIRERLRAGTGTALDVAQQESLIATQRAALPDLRQNIETSRTALALLLGRPPEGFAVRASRIAGLRAPAVAPGQPALVLVRRPDIRQAEAQLVSASADLSAARKALLPSIQLTGQLGGRSAMLPNLLRPESAIWSLAAGLTQPIFDGGRLNAQADLTEGRQIELLELYRKAIVSALVDVENALVLLREGAARENAQAVVVAKAREAFRLSEERLRLGTIDLQTLLSTQNALFQAQDALVRARLTKLQASVSLFQALGGDFVTASTDHGTLMQHEDIEGPR